MALHPGLAAPVLHPPRPLLAALPQDRWPTHADLNALANGVATARVKAIQAGRTPQVDPQPEAID